MVSIDLFVLWMSGFTRRWHMNPAMSRFDDYVCGHQGRCAQLVISMFPDHSLALLRAAVTHDAAEYFVGDLAAPFKAWGGEFVEMHADLEHGVLDRMGFAQQLCFKDRDRLGFVDRLDALLFVRLHNPVEAAREGWPEVEAMLREMAQGLGCVDALHGLLAASKRRGGL